MMIRKTFDCSGPGWSVHTYLRIGRLLAERHLGKCSCSYCRAIRWPVALWLPKDKAWNSWRVIAVKLWRSNWYVRWTYSHRAALTDAPGEKL